MSESKANYDGEPEVIGPMPEPSETKGEALAMTCPFCGTGEGQLTDDPECNTLHAYAYCRSCNARGPSANTFEEAARLWNERAEDHAKVYAAGFDDGEKNAASAGQARIAELEVAQQWHPASKPPEPLAGLSEVTRSRYVMLWGRGLDHDTAAFYEWADKTWRIERAYGLLEASPTHWRELPEGPTE